MLAPGELYRPLVPKTLLAVHRRGSCFGEADLLHAERRKSTVVSSGVGVLAVIPKKAYLARFLSCPSCMQV
jgi:CRP-like cAMP-binding protein